MHVQALADQDHFLYSGYASKIYLDKGVITRVKIFDDKRYVPDWELTMMIPKAMRRKLEGIIEYHLI